MASSMMPGVISPAILPVRKIELPDNPTVDDQRLRHKRKNQKLAQANYRQQSQYHRKMLYR